LDWHTEKDEEILPKDVVIKRIKRENEDVRTFFFRDALPGARPGRYVMVWVRGIDEIPVSLSHKDAITVEKVGKATEALFKFKEGDSIGVRGPFGNGFEIKGEKILLIGGGIGITPLLYLAEVLKEKKKDLTALIGSRSKETIIFLEEFKKISKIYCSTDDGSFGKRGSVTDLLDNMNFFYEMIYVCGPEKMLRLLLEFFDKKNLLNKTQFSLTRIIKCGLGICGSCCIDPKGLRVCRDGPVFYGDEILNSEIGRYERDHAGRRRKI
jgi:dihydroorotate dehydrogenase electron transfer subunit